MNTDNIHWYETLNDGSQVLMRAMRPGDRDADMDFIQRLSEHSRRMRFLGQVRCLPDEELRRLTAIDPARDMAIVAISEEDNRIVGVSRYSRTPDGNCECAVAVADDWQGVGLGSRLMHYLIERAREQGIGKMVSFDLAENARMRSLSKFLGFKTRTDPEDPSMVIHELALA
jgi:GNAT superfamily N-acetyltransferase